MSGPGLDFANETTLVQRALTAIHRSPQPTAALAREVLGLRSAPDGLAARLVYELLGDDRRVEVDRRGVWRPAAPAPDEDPRLADLSWAVVDVETTGGSPARGHRIVELAAVRVRGGRITGEFSTLVNPDAWIPRWITRLTGIDGEMVADAPRFEEVAGLVRRELEGSVFVAHNAGFDWRFVAEEMRRAGAPLPIGPRLCTVRLARRVVPGLRRRGLDALARYYDVEISGRHRAWGDALATAEVLVRMLEEADRRGVERWTELNRWLDTGVPRAADGAGAAGGR